jgi:hypothetical protein
MQNKVRPGKNLREINSNNRGVFLQGKRSAVNKEYISRQWQMRMHMLWGDVFDKFILIIT